MNVGLYARFSGFYFFYFASLGVFLPFWPLYLQHLGFSALEIGQLVAIVMAAGIVAPNLWGWLADHTERRLLMIRLAALGSVLGLLVLQWTTSFNGMAFWLLLFSFFWYASLPLVEGITLNYLDHSIPARFAYVHIRLWGSLGFIVLCLLLAVLTDRPGNWHWVPLALLLCHVGILLMASVLTSLPHKVEHPPHVTLIRLLRHPAVQGLFAALVLMQISHGPYYAFFSIYLESYGYPRGNLALLWSLAVGGEILVFLFFTRYLAHHEAKWLFALAFFLAAVRWAVLGWLPQYWTAVLGAQLLHAATYGLYHAVAIRLIYQLFPGRMQSRGQALYSSLSYGVGASVGSLLAGLSWERFGSEMTFYGACAIALSGMIAGWLAVHYRVPVLRQTA